VTISSAYAFGKYKYTPSTSHGNCGSPELYPIPLAEIVYLL